MRKSFNTEFMAKPINRRIWCDISGDGGEDYRREGEGNR
jgi:hypothetical protein